MTGRTVARARIDSWWELWLMPVVLVGGSALDRGRGEGETGREV